eukprot:TRINITY_DN12234_c0_g2_i2.p1 TRINITY_DN12234_c0_g2~~TRINITY_DN12234_c0_g2_i2.p1  ORF type:complete len:666 (-),score=101.63 TRINITY_DN12234_c0_g2_i2:122-2119(-)
MPKPVITTPGQDAVKDFKVARSVEELSLQMQEMFSSVCEQHSVLKDAIETLAKQKRLVVDSHLHAVQKENGFAVHMHRQHTPPDSGGQSTSIGCEASAVHFDDEDVNDEHKDMLMAVLDVNDPTELVKSEQAKDLLRNRNRYTDELGLRIDMLFTLMQPSRSKSQLFGGKAGELSMPFETLANLIFRDPDKVQEQFMPELVAAIKLLRELSLSDDAREVVKAVLDLNDFEGPDDSATVVDRVVEAVMSMFIVANAFCIGFFAKRSTQQSGTLGAAEITDASFAIIFALEMTFKLCRSGAYPFFMGPDKHWNRFDAFIVILGIVDLLMTLGTALSAYGTASFNASSFTALRIVRLVRLSRLARLIRVPIFRELKLMLYGILALLRTLFCAMMLLFLTVYLLSIIIVQVIPDSSEFVTGQHLLFADLPKSMFTVFRCLMLGDCSSIAGTPIALHMQDEFGWMFTLIYSCACIIMNYGVASLITALVVDSTLNAAKLVEFKQTLNRDEKVKTACRLHKLAALLEESQQNYVGNTFVSEDNTLLFMTRGMFEHAMRENPIKKLLDELDIDEVDQQDLFDAMDADGNGRIEIEELVQGVIKMRGKARKVDVVAARLMLKTLNNRIAKLDSMIRNNHNMHQEQMEALLGVHFHHPEPSPRGFPMPSPEKEE